MGEMIVGAVLYILGIMSGAGILLMIAYNRNGGED